METTITPKYQVHIPVDIRKAIGLKRHGKATITTSGRKIIIEPFKDSFTSLAGSFEVKDAISAEKIRDKISYAQVL